MSEQPRRRGYYNLERVIGRGANALLRKFGYEVVRHREAVSQHAAFTRLKAKRLLLQTVIDVGASDGRWTKEVLEFYPDARYLLVEANDLHRPQLEAFAQQHPNVDYVVGVAGSSEGQIFFDRSDPFGGTATMSQEAGSNFEMLPSITIDQQVQERGLLPPYFIKLDTHGFELPILEGAVETLLQTDLLLIETYNFRLTAESVLFYELCQKLARQGFQPLDLCAPLFRPHDQTLWQVDLFFIAEKYIQGDGYHDGLSAK